MYLLYTMKYYFCIYFVIHTPQEKWKSVVTQFMKPVSIHGSLSNVKSTSLLDCKYVVVMCNILFHFNTRLNVPCPMVVTSFFMSPFSFFLFVSKGIPRVYFYPTSYNSLSSGVTIFGYILKSVLNPIGNLKNPKKYMC